MTPPDTDTPTVDVVVASLERELDALPDPSIHERAAEALHTQHARLVARIDAIRRATATLAEMNAKSAAETKWRDQLTDWRKTLCDEFAAFHSRIYDARTLGRQENLKLSIITIDRGPLAERSWRRCASRN